MSTPPMCIWFHRGIHRVAGIRRCRRRSCVGYHGRRSMQRWLQFRRLPPGWHCGNVGCQRRLPHRHLGGAA